MICNSLLLKILNNIITLYTIYLMTNRLQEKGIQLWHIIPLKESYPRTKSQALLWSALYKSLQRAIGIEDHYFLENKKRSDIAKDSTSKRKIYDTLLSYIDIDPNKLPAQFVEIFKLNRSDPNLWLQVKNIFNKAQYLNKESWRVIFVDGNIIIFRNETRLIHTDSKRKLTQGEKRCFTIQTTFNTFSSLYDAIRSQHYAIDHMKIDQETMLALIEELLSLANDIKIEWLWSKNEVYKRQIDDIIAQLWDVRDYKKLWAVLYNLEQLEYTNKSVDNNRIQWAVHKFTDRFDNLNAMIDITAYRDLPALEKILHKHTNALEMFLAQINYMTDKEYVFSQYQQRLWISKNTRFQKKDIHIPYNIMIEPFWTFYKTIAEYIHHDKFITDIIPVLKESYETYKTEHQEKLSQL